MSRAVVSSANRTEAQSHVAWEAALLKIEFPSGTVKISNHSAPITWGGDTYQPGFIGDPSGVQNLSENANGTATQATLNLSGVDASLIAAAIADDCHWKTVSLWTAYLDYVSGALLNDPIPTFVRKLGVPVLGQGQNSGSLSITLDSVLTALNGKSQVLGNDADQQKRFAGDTGFHLTPANINTLMILAGKQGRVGGGKDHEPGGNGGNPSEPPPHVPISPFAPVTTSST